ncbi:MAG: hypothetical protein WBZ29_17830 [Methanocella sp.]
MTGLKTDESGQWLLLGAMIVAVGLAVLIVFVNQSVLAGHSSSASIMDFPKSDIRELRSEAVNEAYLMGVAANKAGASYSERKAIFIDSFGQFTDDVQIIYTTQGSDIYIRHEEKEGIAQPIVGSMIDNVTLTLFYDNGDTNYKETYTVYLS